MTQPSGVNGADLLPLSLIGCAAWDVQTILVKQRQQITAFEASADSERDDDPPWRFRKIHVHYRIQGRHLNEERIKSAIELAESKYCSIYVTLRDAVALDSDYEIINQEE